jgi:hypothetical protein
VKVEGSFVGTCLAGGETNGNGVGAAGGCADGAMLVLNGFPSFLFSKINYMFDKLSNFTSTGVVLYVFYVPIELNQL